MSAHNAFVDLQRLFASFMEDYAQADRPGWLERLLQGGPSKAERRTITDFYAAVEAGVQSLLDTLTPEDGDLAAQAVRFLIIEADGNDPSTKLTVVATQALAIPLLAHVSSADAAELLADYKARYPKKRMLTPRQEDLLRALESHT